MEIIESARELGKLIQQSEQYKNMMEAKTAFDQDVELQNMIGEFNLKKIELSNQLQNEEKDQDKISALDKEIRMLYQKILDCPNMVIFNVTKKEVDSMLNQVNTILFLSASGENPDEIDLSGSGCSGSCSSCSGCH